PTRKTHIKRAGSSFANVRAHSLELGCSQSDGTSRRNHEISTDAGAKISCAAGSPRRVTPESTVNVAGHGLRSPRGPLPRLRSDHLRALPTLARRRRSRGGRDAGDVHEGSTTSREGARLP